MKKIEVPELDWLERYKRMVGIAYSLFMAADMQIHEDFELEEALPRIRRMHHAAGSECGAKLVRTFDLQPTVEDAIKLFKLYSCEVWGFGSDETVAAELESEDKGTFANLICRGWELAKRGGMEERMKEINCGAGCIAEYTSLLRTLAPDLKIKMTKAYPWGDDRCEFTVTT